MAAIGGIGAAVIAVSTLALGVTPAQAANFVQQPDMQVAVFMVPLTLLVLLLIFEVARIAWRGTLPVQAPPAARPTDWAQPGDGS